MPTPKDQARAHLYQALKKSGWNVQDARLANLPGALASCFPQRGDVLPEFRSASLSVQGMARYTKLSSLELYATF